MFSKIEATVLVMIELIKLDIFIVTLLKKAKDFKIITGYFTYLVTLQKPLTLRLSPSIMKAFKKNIHFRKLKKNY